MPLWVTGFVGLGQGYPCHGLWTPLWGTTPKKNVLFLTPLGVGDFYKSFIFDGHLIVDD